MGWRELVGFAGAGGTTVGGGGGGGGDRSGQVIEGRAVGGGGRREEAGLAIQMDMVTTVVVETAGPPEGKGWGTRGRHTPCGSVGSRMTMAAYDQADLPPLQDHGGLAKTDRL